MASELDTVRALRALFNDMPRAPQGLSHQDTMAWIQRSMHEFEGGGVVWRLGPVQQRAGQLGPLLDCIRS